MPLNTPPDMTNCCKKAKCLSGPNAGLVYSTCDPCPGNGQFNAATCDCISCYEAGDTLLISWEATSLGIGGDGSNCGGSYECPSNPFTVIKHDFGQYAYSIFGGQAASWVACSPVEWRTTSADYTDNYPCTNGYGASGIYRVEIGVANDQGGYDNILTIDAGNQCAGLLQSWSWQVIVRRGGESVLYYNGEGQGQPSLVDP